MGAFGLWLARRSLDSKNDAALAALIAPGLALACWLAAVHALALASHSFSAGLWLGTLGVSVSGMALLRSRGWAARRMVPRALELAPDRAWTIAAALLALLAPASLLWFFHDELYYCGHLSKVIRIMSGDYPPHFPSFPEVLLPYHYGFDTLVALVSALFRLSPAQSISALTLLLCPYAFLLLRALAARYLGARRPELPALAMLLGGGLCLAWRQAPASFAELALNYGVVGGSRVNPPMLSYLFQYPWALGLPLGCCGIVLACERGDGRARFAALTIVWTMLSLCQVVVFAVFGGMLAALGLASAWRARDRSRALWIAGVAAVALAGAKLSGGFFAGSDAVAVAPIHFRPLSQGGGTVTGALRWNLASLGLLLPLGLAGLWGLWRGRGPSRARAGAGWFLAIPALGGIILANTFYYERSWDIVKFETVAQLALGLAAGLALDGLFARQQRLAAALAAVTLLPGLLFVVPLDLALDGLPEIFARVPVALDADDQAAVAWLRRNVPAPELVYRREPLALGYAETGGIAVPWWDVLVPPLPPEREQRRRAGVLLSGFAEAKPYYNEKIRWFVRDSRDQPELVAAVDRWLAQGRARRVARFGDVEVVQLTGEDPSRAR